MKQWENSDDITKKCLLLYKNRKQINNALIENNLIKKKNGKLYVYTDDFICLVKKMFPKYYLNYSQWKVITSLGKENEIMNIINVNSLFKAMEIYTKKQNNILNPSKSYDYKTKKILFS